MSDNNNPSNNRPNLSLVPVDSSRPSENSSNNQDANPSPQDIRQPQTLQDLLKISTRLQSNEGPQEQLTPERTQFLKGALNAMTVDLVPEMQKRLDILKEIQTKPECHIKDNLTVYQNTMEQLIELLYEIDLSQIFYQIDGLSVITPLLRSKHASLRSSAATIIMECCKNNLFCQELSVTEEVYGPLMEMAFSDPNIDAMFHAIGAISAITSLNQAALGQFTKYKGIEMVKKALNSGNEKIVNKSIFLIMSLSASDKTLQRSFTESGVIENLISLLPLSDNIVKEYILLCLQSITKDNPAAQDICKRLNLESFLSQLTSKNIDSETQDQDLCEIATALRNELFLQK